MSQIRYDGRPAYLIFPGGSRSDDRGPPPSGLEITSSQNDYMFPWRPRLPEEGNAEGAQVHRPALLSAAIRPRGDRLLLAQSDDRPPADGFGRVLVVQLWEETVAASLVYGVSGVGPPDQGAVAEGGKGLRVGAPEGASAEIAVEG